MVTRGVSMPSINERRFKKICVCLNGGIWHVVDSEKESAIKYVGNFDNASLICYNYNKNIT